MTDQLVSDLRAARALCAAGWCQGESSGVMAQTPKIGHKRMTIYQVMRTLRLSPWVSEESESAAVWLGWWGGSEEWAIRLSGRACLISRWPLGATGLVGSRELFL